MNILIFTSLITDACLKRRDNREYISFAGRKKIGLLCRSLESLGHTVDVCSTSYAKRLNKTFVEEDFPNGPHHSCPHHRFFRKDEFLEETCWNGINLYWICKHFRKYDLVVFYNYHKEYFLPALVGKKWFGLPILMDYEDGLFLDKGYQSSFYRYLEKMAYRETEGFFLVNGSLKER